MANDPKKRIPDTGRPEPNMPPRDDPHASPLGRGADPGASGHETTPREPGIAGRRGHGSPGERGGPSGMIDRENEDARQERRDTEV